MIIIIKIISIEDLNFSDINEFCFKVLNEFWGPYISCQFLSLFWNFIIMGDKRLIGVTDK